VLHNLYISLQNIERRTNCTSACSTRNAAQVVHQSAEHRRPHKLYTSLQHTQCRTSCTSVCRTQIDNNWHTYTWFSSKQRTTDTQPYTSVLTSSRAIQTTARYATSGMDVIAALFSFTESRLLALLYTERTRSSVMVVRRVEAVHDSANERKSTILVL
jgi:hypothetical protein